MNTQNSQSRGAPVRTARSTLTSESVDKLRRRITGTVIVAGDPGYDEARRVWNGMIDRRPLAVVRAATAADIGPVVQFASARNLPLAIRGGGHNVAGNGTVDDGVVLDLSRLTDVEVDERTRTVRVAAGATLADIDRATDEHHLAVPTGVISGTGIAGLTLGGGVGWLTRAYGLTVDNLVSAEVVTASGESVTASQTENPELFWALHGGGGNFGVVASFTFEAHPLPARVFSGNLFYGQKRWRDALHAYAAWTSDLPDELTSIISFLVPPPGWDLGDGPVMTIGFAWASPDLAAGADVVDRLRRAAPPDGEFVEPTPWVAWQSAADEMFPKGVRAYWKNTPFDRLDDDVVEVIVRWAAVQTWRGTAFDIHHLGGAFARVPEDATPFPTRAARYWLNIYGYWPDADDDEARIAFVRGFARAMEPFASAGLYVNFLGPETSRDVVSAETVYGPAKYERLSAVKRTYDPENIFRLNHNITPA